MCNGHSLIASTLTVIQVLHVNPRSVMFTRKPQSGWVVFHEMEESKMAMYV